METRGGRKNHATIQNVRPIFVFEPYTNPLDGTTFLHIDSCPTPKNKTIDFIRYGGYLEPQRVYDGRSALTNVDL